MDIKEIRELALVMRETGLTALEWSEGDLQIKLQRQDCVQIAVPLAREAQAVEADAAPVAAAENPALVTVESPMVGVFYAAPGEDMKPFVAPGDTVKTGDTLCIIEAMKMMNEITAECNGKIAEVCASNKQVVEYGHSLFRIKPE